MFKTSRLSSIISITAAVTAFCSIAAAEREVYFSQVFYPDFPYGQIYGVNLDGTGLHQVIDTGNGIRGLDVDFDAGLIYWSDVNADKIMRCDLNGLAVEDIVTSYMDWPHAIDVVPSMNKVFWGDSVFQELGSASLDSGSGGAFLSTSFAGDVKVDEANAKIYWNEHVGSNDAVIRRADLDGSNVEVVLAGAGKPSHLAIDFTTEWMYWTDYANDVVRRARLDGTDVQDLYVVGANQNPDGIALDLADGKVYWGQHITTVPHHSRIMRMNLDGSNPETFLEGEFGIIGNIVIIPEPGTFVLLFTVAPLLARRRQ